MIILLADDHPLFREAIKRVLQKLSPRMTVLEATDYPTAFELMHQAGPDEVDIALLDLFMPGMEGLDGITRFRAVFPATPLVVVSASERTEDIHALLALGVSGFISKASPSKVILGALTRVLAGDVYLPQDLLPGEAPPPRSMRQYGLTGRQLDVLKQLVHGYSNRQIGESLELAEGTVKVHVAALFRVLKVNNRTEAVLIAQKMGLHETG